MHAGGGTHLDVAPPLVRDVEVPQCHRDDHETDRDVAQHERPHRGRKEFGGARADGELAVADEICAGRDRGDRTHEQCQHCRRAAGDGHPLEPPARPTEQRRADQPDPEEEQRCAREIAPEIAALTCALAGQRQHHRGQLDDEHDSECRSGSTEIGEVEGLRAAAQRLPHDGALSQTDGARPGEGSKSSALRRNAAETSSSP